MTCPSCAAAEKNPLSPLFHSGGMECDARAMANSVECWESALAGAVTPMFRARMQQVFGADWKQYLPRVSAWADRITVEKGSP